MKNGKLTGCQWPKMYLIVSVTWVFAVFLEWKSARVKNQYLLHSILTVLIQEPQLRCWRCFYISHLCIPQRVFWTRRDFEGHGFKQSCRQSFESSLSKSSPIRSLAYPTPRRISHKPYCSWRSKSAMVVVSLPPS